MSVLPVTVYKDGRYVSPSYCKAKVKPKYLVYGSCHLACLMLFGARVSRIGRWDDGAHRTWPFSCPATWQKFESGCHSCESWCQHPFLYCQIIIKKHLSQKWALEHTSEWCGQIYQRFKGGPLTLFPIFSYTYIMFQCRLFVLNEA